MVSDSQRGRTPSRLEAALTSSVLDRVERLSGLRTVFERVPALLVGELGSRIHTPANVSFIALEIHHADHLRSLPPGFVAGTAEAKSGGGRLLIVADAQAVFAFVNASLGSLRAAPPTKPTGSATKAECAILTLLFQSLTKSLVGAMSHLGFTDAALGRVSEAVDLDGIVAADESVLCGRLSIGFDALNGEVTVYMPQALLAPYRDMLLERPPAEEVTVDAEWSSNLTNEILQVPMEVSAILDVPSITLGDVSDFRVGKVVKLGISSLDRVHLECGGLSLFQCELGKQDGQLVVRVDSVLLRGE